MVLKLEMSFSHGSLKMLEWTGHFYKKHKWDIIEVVPIASCKGRSGWNSMTQFIGSAKKRGARGGRTKDLEDFSSD